VDAHSSQPVGIGGSAVTALLGGEAELVAGGLGCLADGVVVIAIGIGDDRRRLRQVLAQLGQRARQLDLADRFGKLGETAVVTGVGADRDSGGGELFHLCPGGDRLAVDPMGGRAELRRRDEELWAPVGRSPQRLDAVGDRVVGGKGDGAARDLRFAAVEGEDLLDPERLESEEAKRPQLTAEAPRRDVDPLLARLQLAGEAVVDQDGVGGGEAPPLGRLISDLGRKFLAWSGKPGYRVTSSKRTVQLLPSLVLLLARP